VSCGQVLTRDTTLKADLDCSTSESNGIEIGADGITVDLGGHTITGAGADDGYEGVENSGYSDVTVENGGIAGFKDAFLLTNVARMTIDGVKMRTTGETDSNGVVSTYGSGLMITDNKIIAPNYGVQLTNGSKNTVSGNRIVDAQRGVFTTSEAFDLIADNVSDGFSIFTTGFHGENDFRVVYKRDEADGGYKGFYLNNPTSVGIRRSEANDNGYAGIYVDGTTDSDWSAKVVNSVANGNAEYGIFGVFGVTGKGNEAVGNGYFNCHLASCNG
jgi:hypothetical protein